MKDPSRTHLFHAPISTSVLYSIKSSRDHSESYEKPNFCRFIAEETRVNVCAGQRGLGLLPRTRLVSAVAQNKKPSRF